MNRRVRGWGRSPVSRMWDRWVRRTWSARASGSLDKRQTMDPSAVQPDKIRPAVTESLPIVFVVFFCLSGLLEAPKLF